MVFGGANNLELMVEGDPRGLIEGGKMATCIVDRLVCVAILVVSFSDLFSFSVGQCPWLMDLIYHLPSGRSMRFLEKAAAEMMRTRVQRANETDILDLSSYLVRKSVFLVHCTEVSLSSKVGESPRKT